jgi:hypothetical protein
VVKVIEVAGFPEAGKSSMLNQLSSAVKEISPGVRVVVCPEFSTQECVYREAICLGQEVPEMEGTLLDLAKLELFCKKITLLKRGARQEGSSSPALLIVERGPNDALFWQISRRIRGQEKENLIASVRDDLGWGVSVADWDKYWFSSELDRTRDLAWSLGLSLFVDALIFYHVSYETALERRGREGHVVNSEVWPTLEQSSQQLLPWFRYCYGGRFLLVDGGQDLIENNNRVLHFILDQLEKGTVVNRRIMDFLLHMIQG